MQERWHPFDNAFAIGLIISKVVMLLLQQASICCSFSARYGIKHHITALRPSVELSMIKPASDLDSAKVNAMVAY